MSNGKGRNSKLRDPKADSVTKSAPEVGSMAKASGKEIVGQGGGPRHFVRIKSSRVRLLDVDNLYGGSKYLIDALRGASVIPDDDPGSILLEVTQEKIKGYKNEVTEVEVKCV